jgi:hypothetical protein
VAINTRILNGLVGNTPAGAGQEHLLVRGLFGIFYATRVMVQETISKIEGRIRGSGTVDEGQRAELLKLLGQLRGEIATLSKTHQEQAESIASFAEVSAQEATREKKNPETLKHSIGGLESSVGELEKTHPQLTGIVNRIASMLANMGI